MIPGPTDLRAIRPGGTASQAPNQHHYGDAVRPTRQGVPNDEPPRHTSPSPDHDPGGRQQHDGHRLIADQRTVPPNVEGQGDQKPSVERAEGRYRTGEVFG